MPIYHRVDYQKLWVFLSAPYYARRYPLSYVLSGFYGWGDGYLGIQDSYGRWWSITAYESTASRYLAMADGALVPQNGSGKASGFTLRRRENPYALV